MERSGARRSGSPVPYLVLLALAALPLAVAGLFANFGSRSVPPGRCEGLGGGCVMTTADLAQMFLIFAGPVIVAWALDGLLVLALLRRRPRYRGRPAFVQGLLPVVPLLVLLILVFFI